MTERVFGFDLLKEQVVDCVLANFELTRDELQGDSEIERLLFHALIMFGYYGLNADIEMSVPKTEESEKFYLNGDHHFRPGGCALLIRSQAQLTTNSQDDYRVDFLIHAIDWMIDDAPKWRALVVECDGHQFHNSTKEQVAKDRERDRLLMLSGYEIFRFTGSELWRDPWKCAEQVFEWAAKGGWPV